MSALGVSDDLDFSKVGNLPVDSRYPRLTDGARFIERTSSEPVALWGDSSRTLAAPGEPFMISALQGLGKTTLGQQLALARLGLRGGKALGLPVLQDERPVLYLAMDRPRQAARSLARMIETDDERHVLREKLLVYEGPPPFNVVTQPEALADMVLALRCGFLVLDSYKDLAPGLSKDEVGSAVNIALQHVIAAGSELLGLHHQRKATGDNRSPKTLDDVYGSTWITAGSGSVIVLTGNPGDSFVELRHVKAPLDPVGPLTVKHDHLRGFSSIVDDITIEEVLATSLVGVTAHSAAGLLCATADPDKNQVERARRQLERLVGKGLAERRKGASNTDAVSYFAREAA